MQILVVLVGPRRRRGAAGELARDVLERQRRAARVVVAFAAELGEVASERVQVLPPRLRRVAAPRGLQCFASMTDVPMGPPDAILGLNEAFGKDPAASKINLGVGAYRGEDGKPHVLDCVRAAEQRLIEGAVNHEYAGIAGVPEFIPESLKFGYGADSAALKDNRVCGVQALSGTGALRVAGDYFAKFLGHGSAIYVPSPTWGNHIPIFTNAGLEVKTYTYLDAKVTRTQRTCTLAHTATHRHRTPPPPHTTVAHHHRRPPPLTAAHIPL